MRGVSRLLWALVAWTAVVWVGRINNLLGDDQLTSSGRAWRLFLAAVFLGFAALSVAVLTDRWRKLGSTRFVAVFCIWTVTFWAVRGTGILFGDYGASFKAVHAVLAVVSIGLAVPLYRLDHGLGRVGSVDHAVASDDR